MLTKVVSTNVDETKINQNKIENVSFQTCAATDFSKFSPAAETAHRLHIPC